MALTSGLALTTFLPRARKLTLSSSKRNPKMDIPAESPPAYAGYGPPSPTSSSSSSRHSRVSRTPSLFSQIRGRIAGEQSPMPNNVPPIPSPYLPDEGPPNRNPYLNEADAPMRRPPSVASMLSVQAQRRAPTLNSTQEEIETVEALTDRGQYNNTVADALAASKFGGKLDDPSYKEMILVMGMPGVGKSAFCNIMAGGEVVKLGDGQTPCSTDYQPIPVRIGSSKCILIDTPGLPAAPEAALYKISTLLSSYYQRGVSLRGIILLHRISETRISRTSPYYPGEVLRLLQHLLGQKKLQNVTLATTFWQGFHENVGAEHERELRQAWYQVLESGGQLARFYGDRDSGLGIISQLLGNLDLPMELDTDLLVEKGKQLQKRIELERELARIREQLAELA